MFILPSSRSVRRFLAPSARLAPPVSKARLRACWVGEEVVDGGHGVHELLQVEPEAPLLVGVLPVGSLGLV